MRIGSILCLASTAALILAAQDRAGSQIFRIPAGWARSEMQSTTILSPTAEPPNFVVLMLIGYPLNGDFRAKFEENVKGMNGTLRVLKSGEVQSRHTPEGVDLLATTGELQNPNGARSTRYYMAASVRGRFEMLTYMTAKPDLFPRYWPVVQQFVSTWSFANLNASDAPASASAAPPPELLPAPPRSTTPANRLDGVYAGYKYTYPTVLGVVQKRATPDYYSFFPDGSVFWGLPQTGLAGFNMARACQGRADFCGNYQMNGDQVVIVVNRGTYRQVGALSPNGFQIGDRPYNLQGDPAKSAAHTLEGDFGRADAQPGEDLARRFIRFSRDGRFVDQGIVTTVCSSDISTGSPRFERQSGAGTYTLGPYTIILHYSDGYVRQLGVTIEPADMDKPTLAKLFVNTYTLVRRR